VQELVLGWLAHYGAFALFGLLMLGIFGLPVPDETLLTFAGVLISRGTLSLVPTWLAGVLGGVSGISCSYLLGRTTGLFVVHRYGKWLHLKDAQLARANVWLSQKGRWSLTFGYFIPGIRHVTGIVAGASGLPFRIFAAFAYLGALLWATSFVALGWYVGDRWEEILSTLHKGGVFLALLLGIASAIYLLIRDRRSAGAPRK
jgi:membrane protein DedA with SNARE-associated domain